MADRGCDRQFESLEGLRDLGLELSHNAFCCGAKPATYVVGARQLWVLAALADFATKLQRAEDYNEPPERKARLHESLRETLDRFWATPLDTSVIRLHEDGY